MVQIAELYKNLNKNALAMRKAISTFVLFLWVVSISYGQVLFDFQADEFDFGVVDEGDLLSHTFEFANSGKDTIHLTDENRDVRPGCSCTASEFTKEKISPGAKGFVKAGYNTSGRLGIFNKTITISQKGTPYKTLVIKGIVIRKNEIKPSATAKKLPLLQLDYKSHTFPKSEKGKSLIHSFTLKNLGKDTLKLSEGFSACNCINYKILAIKDRSSLSYLLPGKSAFLEITYIPENSVGLADNKINDKLILFSNDPKNHKIELNLNAEIQ